MPNTFGDGTAANTFRLFDPRHARKHRERFRRDAVPALDLATSLYCPGGRCPARGWILLRRFDYDKLRALSGGTGLYSTAFQLQLDQLEPDSPNAAITFKHLAIVQARCVTTGIVGDQDAIYLVELTDKRGVIASRWFTQPVVAYYNVRAPAYPGLYYSPSLNAGSVWTWSGMVNDLWGRMTLLGAFPGLPIVPSGTPENWNFPGVPVWSALDAVLTHLGCSVAVDLRSDTPYTIVSQGADDAAFTAIQLAYSSGRLNRLEDDADWIDVGSGRVPGTVTVLFHRRNEVYGTEETVRRDALQWQTASLYQVSVAAPAFFAGAQGEAILWDDFQVRYDVDGVALPADVTAAAAIAAERAGQFFNEIYSGTQGYMRQVYSGVGPFQTGSLVDGVCWREDFRRRAGFVTEIVRGADPLWPELEGV